MSGNPFANEDVMEDYMSALLTDEPIAEDISRQSVEHLLKNVPVPRSEPFIQLKGSGESEPFIEEQQTVAIQQSTAKNIVQPVIPNEEFQVLLFEVAGLTLAVPLTDLGGIHKITTVSPIFGKPSWLNGVMLHNNEKFNVVDTAKWVMPEKSASKLSDSASYKYIIVLDKSGWGLSCERLIANDSILPEQVKWRNVETSRPWLSGMIKNKMCALMNVPQLINMLNQGLNSKS